MFPDIESENRCFTFAQGRVLVGSRHDFQFFLMDDEPGPAGAETGSCRLCKKFFKVFFAVESLYDGFLYGAVQVAAVRPHDLPKEAVVGMAAAVVSDGTANVFGNSRQVSNEFFRRFAEEFRMLFNGAVQIVDVGLVVLVVVIVHRFFVNVRLESVVSIG